MEFIVWHPDGGEDGPDDGRAFKGSSPYFAALDWAERYNSNGDYSLMDSSEEVMVQAPDGTVTKWRVSAEPSVHYSAREEEK